MLAVVVKGIDGDDIYERGQEKGSCDTSSCHLKRHEEGGIASSYGGIASKEYANRHVTEVVNLYDWVK